MVGDQQSEQVADDLSGLDTQIKHQINHMDEELSKFESDIQESGIHEVKEQLSSLETSIDKIPSTEPPPKTTLQLQGRADIEGAWQNYLQYFLNPDTNHGLETEALILFLRELNSVAQEDLPTRVSDDVVVEAEVSSPNGNRPDIVIQEQGDFFICCELKLYSSEGQNQTQRYVDDNYVGTVQKQQFPEHGHHYVYVRRTGHPPAESPEFVNVTWKQVYEWLKPLVITNQGRYPTRTTAQLTDFLDTIQQDMTQDEHIETAQEKMRLYFNHEDAIREAREGLESVYEYEKENWRRRFIEGYLPENWSEDWHTDPRHYGQFYHSKWRQNGELSLDDTKIQLHFVHLIRNKESFTDGKLTVQLRMPNGGRYRDRFEELFMSDRFADDLDSALGKYDIDKGPGMDYGNPRLTGKTYSVVKSELPESYYETLQQAAKEHIEIVPVINDILDIAIEEVESEL